MGSRTQVLNPNFNKFLTYSRLAEIPFRIDRNSCSKGLDCPKHCTAIFTKSKDVYVLSLGYPNPLNETVITRYLKV